MSKYKEEKPIKIEPNLKQSVIIFILFFSLTCLILSLAEYMAH